MPRTILYSARPAGSMQPAPTPKEPLTFGGPGPSRKKANPTTQSPVTQSVDDVATRDDYAGKLVKFVPAEVLAFFAPMAAAVQGRNGLLIAATVIAFLSTPAYLWYASQKLPPQQKPLVHFYPLSAIAFLAWALGTSKIGSLVGLDSISTSFVLGCSIFLIPLADGLLESIAK